jgi:pyridoxamine 5'-phosphate oxidase
MDNNLYICRKFTKMSGVNEHISKLREDFMKGQLSETAIASLPQLQFENWMKEAVEAKVDEAQAFNLATVSADHKPSSRIVYLREFSENTFYFYTNYQSHKALDIEANPHVCATFFWPELERQIRIEGIARFADKAKSDAYFQVRPAGSKLGAWSSPQSKVIANREALEDLVNQTTQTFEGKEIPRPEFWGGYVVEANYYEFWQGRKSRLHDRIAFRKEEENWKIERLAP